MNKLVFAGIGEFRYGNLFAVNHLLYSGTVLRSHFKKLVIYGNDFYRGFDHVK